MPAMLDLFAGENFRDCCMTVVSAIRVESHTLTTHDQLCLQATLSRPIEPNQRTVLLTPAMGFKQTFYRHYATYLAERGFVTLTFDYRGMGQSLYGSLWGHRARLWQWGALDIQAALACPRRIPAEPLPTKSIAPETCKSILQVRLLLDEDRAQEAHEFS